MEVKGISGTHRQRRRACSFSLLNNNLATPNLPVLFQSVQKFSNSFYFFSIHSYLKQNFKLYPTLFNLSQTLPFVSKSPKNISLLSSSSRFPKSFTNSCLPFTNNEKRKRAKGNYTQNT